MTATHDFGVTVRTDIVDPVVGFNDRPSAVEMTSVQTLPTEQRPFIHRVISGTADRAFVRQGFGNHYTLFVTLIRTKCSD